MYILSHLKSHKHHQYIYHTIILLIPLFIVLSSRPIASTMAFTNNSILTNLPVNTAKMLGMYTSNQMPNCERGASSITAYSRAIYDNNNHQMLMFGGGHAATVRDDVDVFNFNTLTWGSAYNSTPLSDMAMSNYDTVTGGFKSTMRPTSKHTYDMLTYAPNTGELILLVSQQGAAPCLPLAGIPALSDGNPVPTKVWHYNPITKVWRTSAATTALWNKTTFTSEYDPVSGKIIIVDRNGMSTYDPVTEIAKAQTYWSNADMYYGMNLVYYPPNQKMYYMEQNGDVFELVLDRNDFTKSTIVKMTGITGDKPNGDMPNVSDAGETGWAYDSKNKIIGGGVRNGIFYAFDPINKLWTAKTMTLSPVGHLANSIITSHALDYDPVNNVFIYIARDPKISWEFYTWVYKYGDGSSVSTIPAPDIPTTTPVIAINGTCGTSHGNTVSTIPTTNLCTVGTASTISGTGPWTWNCVGNNGGGTASCNAQKTATLVTSPVIPMVTPIAPNNINPIDQTVFSEKVLRISDSSANGTTWKGLTPTQQGSLEVPWKNPGGDWSDKNDTLQGSIPFATAPLAYIQKEQRLDFDVTTLIKRHLASDNTKIPNRGWTLRQYSGTTIGSYYSREYSDINKRPILKVTTSTGSYTIYAGSDANISPSALLSYGSNTSMDLNVVIWFDLSNVVGTVTSAVMTMTSTPTQYGGGTGSVGVWPINLSASLGSIEFQNGISAYYTKDGGIENNPNVYIAEKFNDLKMENRGWLYGIGNKDITRKIVGDTDAADPNYAPLATGIKSYKMTVPTGQNGGDFGTWKFWSNVGAEPEELYTRAYVRIGSNFDFAVGKFPLGIDGRYSKVNTFYSNESGYLDKNPATGRVWSRPDAPEYAGNGGNRTDGTNGWSARGAYTAGDCVFDNCVYTADANPLGTYGYKQLGYYMYHADQLQDKGDIEQWQNSFLGIIPKNQWTSVEEYVKVNTVNADGSGNKDGILRAWVNGRLAYEKKNFFVRNWPGNYAGAMNIRIDGIFLNLYVGGLYVAKSPMDVYMSDLIISKSYIGPGTFTGIAPTAPVTSPIVTPTPISGACGTSHNDTVSTIPVTNLCITGTPSIISGTGPWTWNCVGNNGGGTASCNAQKTTTLAPTIILNAAATSVLYNDTTSISWTSTNTNSCTMNGGYVATSGQIITNKLTESTTYTISCFGMGGTLDKSITIYVGSAPSPIINTNIIYNDTPIPTTTVINTKLSITLSKEELLKQNTLKKVNCPYPLPALSSNLQFGSKGPQVMYLQCKLYLLNYIAYNRITSIYGHVTRDAVKKYQCDKNLICSIKFPAYGKIGPYTRGDLNKM